jgi:predicted  nucleic acid-binding Zn-ribbon protein
MSYLQQLRTHKASLEISVQQVDNDIEHSKKSIEILEDQKETLYKQITLIEQSIADEERKEP